MPQWVLPLRGRSAGREPSSRGSVTFTYAGRDEQAFAFAPRVALRRLLRRSRRGCRAVPWLNGGAMDFSVDRDGVETAMIHDLVDFSGMRVLEVGCGDGRLTWRYGSEASEVVALDVNRKKIKAAVEACPMELRAKVTFQAMDINSLGTGEDGFDIAILSYSL